MKKNNKGFTLVELIVVIAILGVLMAVLVPQYIQYVEKSRIGTDESSIAEIAHNMEINAATVEGLSTGTYTCTITPAGAGKAVTSIVYEAGTGGEAAAATKLTTEVEAVVGKAAAFKLKSKEYGGASTVVITMTDGKLTTNATTSLNWTTTQPEKS